MFCRCFKWLVFSRHISIKYTIIIIIIIIIQYFRSSHLFWVQLFWSKPRTRSWSGFTTTRPHGSSDRWVHLWLIFCLSFGFLFLCHVEQTQRFMRQQMNVFDQNGLACLIGVLFTSKMSRSSSRYWRHTDPHQQLLEMMLKLKSSSCAAELGPGLVDWDQDWWTGTRTGEPGPGQKSS